MNEAMRIAWLEISQMVNVTTPEELDVFLRTWQRAIQAEREECAKICDSLEEQCEKLGVSDEKWPTPADCASVIRARGQA
jgi:hypothetical protein